MAVKTFSVGEVLTAADTNTYLANGGLVYVTTGTLTTVSSTNYLKITGAFPSAYDSFRLVINGTGSAPASLVMRFGTGGTAAITNYFYAHPYWYSTAGGDGVVRSTGGQSSMVIGFFSGAVRTSISLDVFRPNQAETTQVAGQGVGQNNASLGNAVFSIFGYHNTATAYDELYLGTNGADTFTGTCQIYGYRKA